MTNGNTATNTMIVGNVLISALIASASAKSYYRYEWAHSLYAPYVNMDGKNNHWDFDALVSMHNFVQLTPDAPNRVGSVFSKKMLGEPNWVIDFFFKITGPHPADGMAFWFTEDGFVPGKAFGNKENFKGLGVFLDVFNNKGYHYADPIITAMVGDGVKVYDHDHDGREHSVGGCHAAIANTQEPVQMRVVYNKNTLDVSYKIDQEGDFVACLHAKEVHLPRSGYVGFSAHTGALSAKHELLAVTTAVIENDSTFNDDMAMAKHRNISARKVFIFIATILIVGFVCYYYNQNSYKAHHF